MVKAQVKAGGRGKAGGVKFAATPERRRRARQRHPRHGHQGPRSSTSVLVDRGQRHRRGVLRLLPARPRQPHLPGDGSVEGGMEIEELAAEQPEALARGPGRRRSRASTGRRRARSRRRAASPPRCCEQVVDHPAEAVGGLRRRGRHAGRGQPAGARPRGPGPRARRQGHPRRQRRLPPPGPRRVRGPAAADPLEAQAKEKDLNYVKLDGEVGIIGNGAGLVMCTLDVVAYAGEEHGGVKPANFLDIGGGASARGDGRRPGDHPGRPSGQAACSSTSSAASRRATRSPTASCRRSSSLGARQAVDKPLVVRLDGNNADEGRRILADAATRWSSWSTPWTVRRRRAAELRQRQPKEHDHGDLPRTRTARSSSRASPAPRARSTPRACSRSGTQRRRRRQRRARPARPVDGATANVAAGVRHRRRGDGGDRRRRLGRLRAAGVRQGRGHRGHRRRRSRCVVVITEGIPVHDTRVLLGLRRERRATTRIIGPNCPGLISPGQVATRASSRPTSRSAGPDRPGVQVGHADLPDDVRAARHRLLHRRRHRRRPGHRHHAHRLPRRRSRTTRRPRRS